MNFDANASFLNPNFKPNIPVGTVLHLEGNDYEIIGVLEKKEENSNYYWREYYLESSFEGIRFLAEYEGHWMFLQEIPFVQLPRPSDTDVSYNETTYQLFNTYKAEIRAAAGVFPIDLSKVKHQQVIEYINPPELLTVEYDNEQTDWFLGKHIEPKTIEAASRNPLLMPHRYGVGAVQPGPVKFAYWEVLKFSVLAAIVLAITQLFFVITAPNSIVLDESFVIQDRDSLATVILSQTGKIIVTPSFELKNGTKNLDFTLNAAVSNSWFETEITLINEKTGEERGFSFGVEFYEGVESGERWAEGETTAEYEMEGVPSGVYHLEITPVREIKYNNSGVSYLALSDFKLKVKRDVPYYASLFFLLILFSLYPLVQYIREYYFESARWRHSDYSPYHSDD